MGDLSAPSALARAAAVTLSRDAIWEDPPPLDAGCAHALRCLPVVEFRQTVLCARCGGLDAGLSRDLTRNPAGFAVSSEGHVTRRGGV